MASLPRISLLQQGYANVLKRYDVSGVSVSSKAKLLLGQPSILTDMVNYSVVCSLS